VGDVVAEARAECKLYRYLAGTGPLAETKLTKLIPSGASFGTSLVSSAHRCLRRRLSNSYTDPYRCSTFDLSKLSTSGMYIVLRFYVKRLSTIQE